MITSLYTNLRRKMIGLTLSVSLAPLIILGSSIYLQFAGMYKTKIEEQILYRATAHAEAVDLFLKERVALLGTIADTSSLDYILADQNLSYLFQVMNSREGAFVDLGVIDSTGQQVAYVGAYDLKGKNYFQQTWFVEVRNKGVYISDVYMGYRQIPHFIIAVRRYEKGQFWILRATIDPDVFGSFVRSAQLGKSGDAFIVNDEGIYQTMPRFGGKILSKFELDTTLFGAKTTVIEHKQNNKTQQMYAGTRLKDNKWILVISQDVKEEMSGLFATQQIEVIIMICGLLAILLTTIFTTRLAIDQLKTNDKKMSKLNAQLIQSDKLAAIGKMAAGVAHEINNPLAVILQKTGWMEDLLIEEEFQASKNYKEFQDSIKKIEEHVERARKVVHNMLGYARKMEPHQEDVDINKTLNQTMALLSNYARINNIKIQPEFSTDLPVIASDESQLQQVFLNLISNAIDAIEKDGLIKITSTKTDTNIQISIIDNGPGIAEDQQKRVFDPFFTTKAPGKGTGLGLWICYDIMQKLGGNIQLKSKKGEGATFIVDIPIIIPEKK